MTFIMGEQLTLGNISLTLMLPSMPVMSVRGERISLEKCVWGHTFPGGTCTYHCGMLENPERSGTERNGTEPEVIVAQYRRGHRICYGKLVLGISMYGELISRPVPATKTGQAPSRQYRAIPRV